MSSRNEGLGQVIDASPSLQLTQAAQVYGVSEKMILGGIRMNLDDGFDDLRRG